MIEVGQFRSHSGVLLPWKINLDDWTIDDWNGIARLIAFKLSFSRVHGISRGGKPLEKALEPYRTDGHSLLIVDDVLTTGESMEEARSMLGGDGTIGVVVFSRARCIPTWIRAVFSVNEWIVR